MARQENSPANFPGSYICRRSHLPRNPTRETRTRAQENARAASLEIADGDPDPQWDFPGLARFAPGNMGLEAGFGRLGKYSGMPIRDTGSGCVFYGMPHLM